MSNLLTVLENWDSSIENPLAEMVELKCMICLKSCVGIRSAKDYLVQAQSLSCMPGAMAEGQQYMPGMSPAWRNFKFKFLHFLPFSVYCYFNFILFLLDFCFSVLF